MKRFVASICLRTFIRNHSFGLTEDEDKSLLFTRPTSLYTFTNFGQMIGLANIRKNLQVCTKLKIIRISRRPTQCIGINKYFILQYNV